MATLTDTTETVWIDDNGRIACLDHGGYAMKSEAKARPNEWMLFTERGTWLRMDADGIAMLRDMYPTGPLCETCRYDTDHG